MAAENPGTKTAADSSVEQVAENAAQQLPRKTVNLAWVNREWIAAAISFVLLSAGLIFDFNNLPWFNGTVRFSWYAVAFIPVGFPVMKKGVTLALRGELFTEFLLMSIATLGAFYIGEYPEGVAVMVFYAVGELLQGAAVARAKRNIKALLDVRPNTASVLRGDKLHVVDAQHIKVGETMQVRAGERVALDGTLLSEESTFNSSALTGESAPVTIVKGDIVLAGMINEGKVIEVAVSRIFEDSALARILALVQNAQGRKAKTELFIRRFARYYTPVVVFLAVAVTFLPYFFVADYNFNQWLYRALIFLVISCPCALVVAIPLGYFGGIGAGSRNGILFKGSAYLDRMTRIGAVVFDKTGTLTRGTFKVTDVVDGVLPRPQWLPFVSALEQHSTHPAARAVAALNSAAFNITAVEEFRGYGLKGVVEGKEVVAGNAALFRKLRLSYDTEADHRAETVVLCSINGVFAGYVVVSDEIRPEASGAIQELHAMGITTALLSGDKQTITEQVARQLNIPHAFGALLPEDKVNRFDELRKGQTHAVAFVGDGINDAPVIAVSDVGIALGGMATDAAIETADVVVQTDNLSRIATAIHIGKATNAVIWQNIAMAFLVKFLVLALGTAGMASMWEAVFADVGVALLAIANAIRIQYMRFT